MTKNDLKCRRCGASSYSFHGDPNLCDECREQEESGVLL